MHMTVTVIILTGVKIINDTETNQALESTHTF